MVQPDGKPVLLDLGAAKDLDIQGKDGSIQTTQMVAKQGFSPIEQYRKKKRNNAKAPIPAAPHSMYFLLQAFIQQFLLFFRQGAT